MYHLKMYGPQEENVREKLVYEEPRKHFYIEMFFNEINCAPYIYRPSMLIIN